MRAFTLVELLIVIGITIIFAVAAIPIYGNLQVSSQLNDAETEIIQFLRTAQQESMARYNSAAHGVKFQADRYILYQGSTHALRDSDYDRETVLDSSMELSWSLFGTGQSDEVNFSKGLGVPDMTGTITVTHDVQGTRVISINSYGKVEEQ